MFIQRLIGESNKLIFGQHTYVISIQWGGGGGIVCRIKMSVVEKELSYDPEHYTKSFTLFRQNSDLEQVKDEWFRNNLPEVLKPVLSLWQIESLPECRVLGVGSAEGKFDFAILEVIINGFAKASPTKLSLFNRVVEPSSSSIDGFKADAAEWSKTREEDVDANFELIQETFQEYALKQREAGRFHFIHFINSIYYMNAEEVLCHLVEKELATNGAILLLTFAENSFWIRFARRFHDTGVCPSPPAQGSLSTRASILFPLPRNTTGAVKCTV